MTITAHLTYLQRNAFCPLQIHDVPHAQLGMVLVIPCFDEPDLNGSLEALWRCTRPQCAVEVIVVVNSGVQHGPEVRARNAATISAAEAWIAEHDDPKLRFFVLHHPDLPKKHAGVGLARKIGMDEAVGRLARASRISAPIVCFDADAGCDPNYLVAIEQHFQRHPETPGCSIYYEHPLEGPEAPEVYAGILRYELYLRYYVQALRWAGHPHAYHTIGSSMAVRSNYYQMQGGMNRRKAGEDFHFLQKIIPLGGFTELTATRVLPSPRISDRVPFGTGKAMGDYVAAPSEDYPVYAPEGFRQLRVALAQVRAWYALDRAGLEAVLAALPELVRVYWERLGFVENVLEIQQYTRDVDAFYKRFFRWFHGLRVLQYFHFVRDEYLENVGIVEAANVIAGEIAGTVVDKDLQGLLEHYRRLDRP